MVRITRAVAVAVAVAVSVAAVVVAGAAVLAHDAHDRRQSALILVTACVCVQRTT